MTPRLGGAALLPVAALIAAVIAADPGNWTRFPSGPTSNDIAWARWPSATPQIPLAQVLKFEVRPNAEDDHARSLDVPAGMDNVLEVRLHA